MTTYETKLRGARKRLKEALELAPLHNRDDVRDMVAVLDDLIANVFSPDVAAAAKLPASHLAQIAAEDAAITGENSDAV